MDLPYPWPTLPEGVNLAAKPLGSNPDIDHPYGAISSKEVPHRETTKVEVPIVQTKWDRASKARGRLRKL